MKLCSYLFNLQAKAPQNRFMGQISTINDLALIFQPQQKQLKRLKTPNKESLQNNLL